MTTLLLTGKFEARLDAKQRLAVPAKLRERLSEDRLYATLGEELTIWLYPPAGFQRRIDELKDSDRPIEEILEFERMFLSWTHELELDRQGRIRLPEQLMSIVRLEREVVVLGNNDHIEIHDRSKWQSAEQAMVDRLLADPSMLMNPRRFVSRCQSDERKP